VFLLCVLIARCGCALALAWGTIVDPIVVDLLGYLAGALVLVAFSLQSLVALRCVAIGSNLAFIAYAIGAHVLPVLVLHAGLLPINAWRLWQCVRPRRIDSAAADRVMP